jgi:cholesterol transport system auxiliary component
VKRIFLAFICATIALLSGGCSLLGAPVKTPELHTYRLQAELPKINAAARGKATLLIANPKAIAPFDSSKMQYVQMPYVLKSFRNNRWAAPPTQMLASQMQLSLQSSGEYAAVVMEPYIGAAKWRLDSQLLDISQDFSHNPTMVKLAVNVQLLDLDTKQVVVSKLFNLAAATRQNTAYSGVLALNILLNDYLQQLNNFVDSNSDY